MEQKEKNLCQVCEKRYTTFKIATNKQENLPICMHCLKEKMDSGEVELKGKEKVEFLERMNASVQHSEVNKKDSSLGIHDMPIFALQFGQDLTQKAKEGKLDPLVGREKEIESTLRIMERRFKNNPIIVGEAGVGKTAIVEGIAAKIASGDVGENLRNKKMISISIGNLLAGTKYRGEFEDRMKKLVDELRERKDIILFLDEFHTIMSGGGGEGGIDAAQMLKPALSRGEIQIIGTTTQEEYRLYIEKDKALERRFQKVTVAEPSLKESVEIIQGIKARYESFHDIEIPDEVIIESVLLSNKYITDRMLPDKAIDLIDEACAHKAILNKKMKETVKTFETELDSMDELKLQALVNGDYEAAKKAVSKETKLKKDIKKREKVHKIESYITKDDLAYILNQWTGIPVQKMSQSEVHKLRTLSDDLKKRVKGQDKAVEVLTRSIKRNMVGLKDDNRPIGVFMMLGPTGVGKTELSKALAETLLGKEEKMIRIDMSEYMEPHSVAKLLGAPPGYAGYEDEGKLTKAIRQNPYSVVLFDEIEKAHPDITNILLQLFDEGRITNAKGRTVDARNVVFIMTSNVGSDLYTSKKTSLGYNTDVKSDDSQLETKIKQRLKTTYRPEFLNRIDDFLVFNRLTKENVLEITEKLLNELVAKLSTKSINLKYNKAVVELIAEKGFEPDFGARPLRREIDQLKNLITDKIIEEENVKQITLTARDGKLHLK